MADTATQVAVHVANEAGIADPDELAEDAAIFAHFADPRSQRRDVLNKLINREIQVSEDEDADVRSYYSEDPDNVSAGGASSAPSVSSDGDDEEPTIREPPTKSRGVDELLRQHKTNPQFTAPTPPMRVSSEKRELMIKLDEMRQLGFNIPEIDPRTATLEDLQTEVSRRTVGMSTVATVDQYIGWINTGATMLEAFNSHMGPFLPLNNYAAQIEKATKKPRFKYALYQLILRYQGRGGLGPWKEILLVLLLPILNAFAVKAIIYFSKGRVPLNPSMVSGGVTMGLNKLFGRSAAKDKDGGGVFNEVDSAASSSDDSSSEEEDDETTDESDNDDDGGGGDAAEKYFPRARAELAPPPPFIIPK
jgi:hypothetical protein